jgi:hypothetical protein
MHLMFVNCIQIQEYALIQELLGDIRPKLILFSLKQVDRSNEQIIEDVKKRQHYPVKCKTRTIGEPTP